MKPQNDLALKEWAVVIKAMLQGRQVLLLRKGGIEETAFELRGREFWLFPTHEHQSPERIRPEFHEWLKETEGEWEPKWIALKAYGIVEAVFSVGEETPLVKLTDEHIWTESHLKTRLRYKPRLPLYALIVRVYHLPIPHRLENHPDYSGCRSWVPLKEPLPTEGLRPVLSGEAFSERLERIRKVLGKD